MFAALSAIEPPILERETALLLENSSPWRDERLPLIENRIRKRLAELSDSLGGCEWLEEGFSAGDLMMVGVLRQLNRSGLLSEYPNIAAYVARGEARPAFKRAFAAQLEVFTASQGRN